MKTGWKKATNLSDATTLFQSDWPKQIYMCVSYKCPNPGPIRCKVVKLNTETMWTTTREPENIDLKDCTVFREKVCSNCDRMLIYIFWRLVRSIERRRDKLELLEWCICYTLYKVIYVHLYSSIKDAAFEWLDANCNMGTNHRLHRHHLHDRCHWCHPHKHHELQTLKG